MKANIYYIKVIMAATIFLLILLFSIPSFAVLFDFNDNKRPKGWEEVGGKWEVKNGEYCGNEPAENEGVTVFGDKGLTDVTIEATVKNAQGAWMALVVRWNDKDNQHGWWINLGGNSGEWWVKNAGTYVQDASAPVVVDRKQYTIKIVAKGDTFEGYYNGKLIATMKNNTLKQGRTGLLVWQGNSCFDDVKISGKGIPEAVSPQGNLTTTWARVRITK